MNSSPKLTGQDQAVTLLANAIRRDQVAHAYSFSGPEGVGKKTLARIFAASLLCPAGSICAACTCPSCRKVASDNHPDVMWVGLDPEARSIGIDEIRDMQSWVALKPLEAKRKVFIIENAGRLTEEAANAFLKTLEEPPQHTYIVVLAEELFQLLPTVRSRVVEVRLVAQPVGQLAELLRREHGLGEQAVFLASLAEGSIGRALRYAKEGFVEEKNAIIDTMLSGDMADAFLELVALAPKNVDRVLAVVAGVLHDLLLIASGVDRSLVINADRVHDLERRSRTMSVDTITKLMALVDETRSLLDHNVNTKLLVTRLAGRAGMVV